MKRHMLMMKYWKPYGNIRVKLKKREGGDDIIKLIKLNLLNHYSYHIDLAKFGYILHMKVGEKNPSTFLATYWSL